MSALETFQRYDCRDQSLSLNATPEQEVEPRFPRLAAVERRDRRFSDAARHGTPDTAYLLPTASLDALDAAQKHFTVVRVPLDRQQRSVVCDPRLVPYAARCVVDAEALTLPAGSILVELVQHAPAERALDPYVRYIIGAREVGHIPITNPKVERPVRRRRTGPRRRRCSGPFGRQ